MQETNLQLAKKPAVVKVAPSSNHHHATSSSSSGTLSRHSHSSFNKDDVPSSPNTSNMPNNDSNNNSNGNVDFIGPSNAVKHLFSLPYNTDKNVSVALHNMGNGTLLFDSGDDFLVDNNDGCGDDNNNSQESSSNNSGRYRGRRRQRPTSWKNSIQEEEDENGDGNVDENAHLQLAQQFREGEKSLLASLSLLLEEEKKGGHATVGDNLHHKDQVLEETSDALIVPLSNNNAIIVKDDEVEETTPIVSSAPPTTTTTSTTKNGLRKEDGGGPLSNATKLHPPPQHYLSHVVAPPTEPRQYANWNFHDMKLLVASDAVIYKSNNKNGEESSSNYAKTESIALRVADVSDLKSQMKYNENMMTKEGGLFPASERRSERRALPPSSYAEALLAPPSVDDEEEDVDNAETSCEDDYVKLQTSIIPATMGAEHLANLGFLETAAPSCINNDSDDGRGGISERPATEATSTTSPLPYSSTPVCTVLDSYLDNLITNVPQLALILREQGYVQNIKLLRTEDIPSLMMHPSTLGVDESSASSSSRPIFSPDIVEMNASMLLRFLKSNCTRENSTYLLHRKAGDTNIQLFDISSISEMRQRKWVWWLALCSYRFACRLEQLQRALSPHDRVTRRDYRNRQRNLLHNTLNLLEELADMEGSRHETIGAAVCEHLADTYLWNDEADGEVNERDSSKPTPCASSSQPYKNVTVDCLDKAHDHLMHGIKKLSPLLMKARKENASLEIEALSTQLYGIHRKIINVNLRLADHHLQKYFSSNLIQSLRTAGRMLSDAAALLKVLNSHITRTDSDLYARSIILQYAWLWEYCGHFARSFAADHLWRERGHTCGTDLITLFQDVHDSCSGIMEQCLGGTPLKANALTAASHGQVSLNSISGIVLLPDDFDQITGSVLQKDGCHEAIGACRLILDHKTQIKRDAHFVLVAAAVCYSHAIDSYVVLASRDNDEDSTTGALLKDSNLLLDTTVAPLLRQRLGDACNEVGKTLLSESRDVLSPQYSFPATAGTSNTSFDMSHCSAVMLASAQFWFNLGLEQFTKGNDLRNLALLRCNLCQCCKIRATTNVILPGDVSPKKKKSESYLQDAVDHLILAHEAMGQRDVDPLTWDMVSDELAATLLVLGVRRRQSALPASSEPLLLQALRLTPGIEKAIVEPMERSCRIYESLGTPRASHQAAAAHYQLALYFSKVWTCQRDEVKTRSKLAAAFKHFGKAHQYFFHHMEGNEVTFIVLR